jgi:hypothetical protein
MAIEDGMLNVGVKLLQENRRLKEALEAIHRGAAAGTPGETFRQFARRTASKALQTDSTLPP